MGSLGFLTPFQFTMKKTSSESSISKKVILTRSFLFLAFRSLSHSSLPPSFLSPPSASSILSSPLLPLSSLCFLYPLLSPPSSLLPLLPLSSPLPSFLSSLSSPLLPLPSFPYLPSLPSLFFPHRSSSLSPSYLLSPPPPSPFPSLFPHQHAPCGPISKVIHKQQTLHLYMIILILGLEFV